MGVVEDWRRGDLRINLRMRTANLRVAARAERNLRTRRQLRRLHLCVELRVGREGNL